MRVAALYDIHGNSAALAAVLAEVPALSVDLIVVGGDIAAGPFPGESIDAVRALGDRALAIRGNGDRELVEARLRLERGLERVDPDDVWSLRTHWAAAELDEAQVEWLRDLPPLASVDIDGLGETLFCHASPRSDEEIVTELSSAARIAPMLAGIAQHTIVLGHTHVQFDRRVAGTRLVNAGSVGLPYEGEAAAFWALIGPQVELRRTSYDVPAVGARIRTTGIPAAGVYAEELAAPPGRAEASEFFERMATREQAT